MSVSSKYPNNSGIHIRKAEGRKQRARATFAEKLAALDDLKARVAPIVRARETRKQSHPLASRKN